MQFTGILLNGDTECLFEDDIAKFDYIEDGFEMSTCGKIMKEYNVQSLLIHFEQSKWLCLNYHIYFVSNNKILTEKEWFKYTDEQILTFAENDRVSLNDLYSQSDSQDHFIRYLAGKGLKIIGNIYSNPELLTNQK